MNEKEFKSLLYALVIFTLGFGIYCQARFKMFDARIGNLNNKVSEVRRAYNKIRHAFEEHKNQIHYGRPSRHEIEKNARKKR